MPADTTDISLLKDEDAFVLHDDAVDGMMVNFS